MSRPSHIYGCCLGIEIEVLCQPSAPAAITDLFLGLDQHLSSLPSPLRLMGAHRDDGIDSPTPRSAVLDADRPDFEFVALTLKDDAIVVVSLGMDDLSQIQVHPA